MHVSSTHPPCLYWLSIDLHLTNLSPKVASARTKLGTLPPPWEFPRERNFQRNTSSRLQLLLPPGSFFPTTCKKMRASDWLPRQTTHIFNSKQNYWQCKRNLPKKFKPQTKQMVAKITKHETQDQKYHIWHTNHTLGFMIHMRKI